jgi:1-deoxy-D-xylulose-5-phosphate reductoisomerase
MQTGGLSGAIFNAAKEQALDAFIAGEIGFLDMARVVETVLEQMSAGIAGSLTLDAVHDADSSARRAAETVVRSSARNNSVSG